MSLPELLSEFVEHLQSPDFHQLARHADHPGAFTRRRKRPLPSLITLMLCGMFKSTQAELDVFFAHLRSSGYLDIVSPIAPLSSLEEYLGETTSILTGRGPERTDRDPARRDVIDYECPATPPRVRLVRHVTPNGRVRVLMTNLFDTQRFPAPAFGDIYHQRWRIEVAFERFKHRLNLEHVSGSSHHQDFAAKILCDPDRASDRPRPSNQSGLYPYRPQTLAAGAGAWPRGCRPVTAGHGTDRTTHLQVPQRPVKTAQATTKTT